MLKAFFAILDGCHQFVVRREGGIGDVLVHELDSVAETSAPSGFDVARVGAVVVGRCGEVPSVD